MQERNSSCTPSDGSCRYACRQYGPGAKNVLEAQRIEVIRGCGGDVEELVAAYLAGNVKDNGESCDHHDCH